MKSAYATAAALLLCLGCSGGEAKPDKDKDSKVPGVDVVASKGDCLGELVPPSGYEQESVTLMGRERGVVEAAKSQARARLVQRLCQGFRCNALAPKIKIWRTAADASSVCAMAVVSKSDVAAFRAEAEQQFRRSTSKSASAMASRLIDKLGRDKLRLSLGPVVDNGVRGGARAEWVHDRLVSALSGVRGVELRKVPADWSGLGLPQETDAVVRGRIVEVPGQEATLELSWRLDLGDSFLGIEPYRFPKQLAPEVATNTQMPDLPGQDERQISLNLATRPGGGLCAGQATELHLEASRKLHARVINLYGNQAIVLATNDIRKGAALKARRKVSLGKFQVTRPQGPAVERFVVVAAPKEADLGRLGAVTTTCRLSAEAAAAVREGSLPAGEGILRTGVDYRVMTQGECSAMQAPEGAEAILAKLPTCW